MPFTVSHAAAVLPFSRSLNRHHLLSAAIIGSMAPDFGYFLPWPTERLETHGIIPLFTFCLPVGLLTFWLFQYLLKQTLLELLPDRVYWRWQNHVSPRSIRQPTVWLMAAIGILAGGVTHLAWDGFTHESARGVQMFPSLHDPVELAGHSLYGYAALQLISSVVGLAVVVGFVIYTLRPDTEATKRPARPLSPAMRRYWLKAIAIVAAGVFLSLFAIGFIENFGGMGLQWKLREAAVAAMRSLVIALLSISFALRKALRDGSQAA